MLWYGLCEGRLAVFVSACDDDIASLHLVCMNSCLHEPNTGSI